MKTVSVSEGARQFASLVALAEGGETVRFQKDGHTVARMEGDSDFMDGREAARLFAEWADKITDLDRQAADAIAAARRELREEENSDLADRLGRAD